MRQQVFGQHLARLDHLVKIFGRHPHRIGGSLHRPREALAQLLAHFLHADDALADHLTDRQQRAFGICRRFAEHGHRPGHGFEHRAGLRAFHRRALGRSRQPDPGTGSAVKFDAEPVGGFTQPVDFRSRSFAAAGHLRQRAGHAFHAQIGVDERPATSQSGGYCHERACGGFQASAQAVGAGGGFRQGFADIPNIPCRRLSRIAQRLDTALDLAECLLRVLAFHRHAHFDRKIISHRSQKINGLTARQTRADGAA